MRVFADQELAEEFSGPAFTESSEGPEQGLVLCREGRVAWASERMAQILGCESPEDLVGADLGDLDFDGRSGRPAVSRSPGRSHLKPVGQREGRLRAQRVPLSEGELWVVDAPGSGRRAVREPGLDEDCAVALGAAKREVAELRGRLQRERAERDELLEILAHEFKTPMSVVNGYSRLLLSGQFGALSADQERAVREANQAGQHLGRLIQHLLESAQDGVIEGGLDVAPRNLITIFEGVRDLLAPLMNEKSLKLEFQITPDAILARVDKTRIQQVMSNLLVNAIKFSDPGSSIRIGTRLRQRDSMPFVEVSVSDEGPGIDEENLDRIFEPYFRGGGGSHTAGLGLGLSICRRIVESHGGEIRAMPASGGGARFVFTLPAAVNIRKVTRPGAIREVR